MILMGANPLLGPWKSQLLRAQMGTRFAGCHFRTQKSLDFQGPPLSMALEIDSHYNSWLVYVELNIRQYTVVYTGETSFTCPTSYLRSVHTNPHKRAGENPIKMSGSDLCIPRNETVWPGYFLVLSPNLHIHVSVSDIYITRIGLPILLYPNRQTDLGNIQSPRLKRSGTKTVPDALPHKLDPKNFFPPFPV